MRKYLYTLCACCISLTVFGQQPDFNLQQIAHLPYTDELSNIWGYTAPNGTEYALVGTTTKLSIVSLATPSAPVEVANIPGPTTAWREMKTWGSYCYTSLDNVTVGMLIVDMSNLPNAVTHRYWRPTITINGVTDSIKKAHTVTMDDNGYMYFNGTNLINGAPLIFDVHTNPGNPIYIGHVGDRYCHDNFVRNDTLWSSDIYDGVFRTWDVSNKTAPVLLATQATPNNFTHNSWLSDDSRTLFTTDERANSFLAAYDVSDLTNIRELDRYRPPLTLGMGVIPHNAHVLNDYVFLSYYTDGVKIIDGHRPTNLVEVGSFDSYPGPQTGGFYGDWGVYPYFASGNIVLSDINTGLWVLRPTLVRACYLEGNVTDANTTNPLYGAQVTLNNTHAQVTTDLSGAYATGWAASGTFTATYSAPGYVTQTITVTLSNGVVNVQNIQLVPVQGFRITGNVLNDQNSQGISGAIVTMSDGTLNYTATANSAGDFAFPSVPTGSTFTVYVGAWGYHTTTTQQAISGATNRTFRLTPGYRDEFAMDLGWNIYSNASTGRWERGVPVGIMNGNTLSTPNSDVQTDLGDQCYVTGNSGTAIGDNDVDGGYTSLRSPSMDLSTYVNPHLKFNAWFENYGGTGNPNDTLWIILRNGTDSTVLGRIDRTAQAGVWSTTIDYRLKAFVPVLGNNVKVVFRTADNNPGHIVEAGIDAFEIIEDPNVGFDVLQVNSERLNVYPNPTTSLVVIESNNTEEAQLKVTNLIGQTIYTQTIAAGTETFSLNTGWAKGAYILSIQESGKSTKVAKLLVK